MGDIDFQRLFEQSPDGLMVLLPDAPRYTLVACTEARFRATHTTRDTIGRGLFEVFPDNPDDATADGTSKLRASLDRVVRTKKSDTMAVQKYDIRVDGGRFEVKYWSPKNIPVLGEHGELLYIMHRAEDVTELVLAREKSAAQSDRVRHMEDEVLARSAEIAEKNGELTRANQRLGELDIAKTAFFSNVSHEFRTPLTLMLGPLEDMLSDPSQPLEGAQRMRASLVHDNALRLYRQVNALLDFSKLEAGRLRARFEATDLGVFTAELASMFRAVVQRAGLSLVIDCPSSSEPAYVDREMWEKIVPNLLSNAFKFTFEGQIVVRLAETRDAFVLEVRDTGLGIPEHELAHVFERFHRVAGAVGRTHEGTGIGLSLVRQLVELHGGRIGVASRLREGTTFRVTLPKGRGHLPDDAHTATERGEVSEHRQTLSHVQEALRWELPRAGFPERAVELPREGSDKPRILLVDDHADLRDYVAGLLAPSFEVTTARDGMEALELVHGVKPELVLSDVMMPRLDGIGLVQALRASPETATLPVILLSARAGEEAQVAGLDTGCDDYLVKPFTARELLARVRTHVSLARTRKKLIAELKRANAELDSFSYSVSHDLRAPLRAIDGFAHALEEENAQKLDDLGRHYLARIRHNTGRMALLIDAMLSLSRISRAPLRMQTVDLSALANDVITDLRRSDPAREAHVRIEPGLVATGDAGLLAIVLGNLLGNAWKYSRPRACAHIEVGRLPAEEPTFFVRDDGAGFDMNYAHKLFAPFERLHKAEDFEGTGVGLATVQRVIRRHHGRVWAESAPGEGATFYFSVPTPLP